jgi:putative ABC transport system permease protein
MHERTRELGMLRAIGTTRGQVRAMVAQEGVITALIGTALGIGLGIVLSALATAALRDQGVVYAIPAATLVGFAVVGALAGMLSSIVPARRAARLDVLNALQYE